MAVSPLSNGPEVLAISTRHRLICLLLAVAPVFFIGCDSTELDYPSNRLFAHRLERETEESLEAVSNDVHQALEEYFGTVDEPKWPLADDEDSKIRELVSVEFLKRAAGPVGRGDDKVEIGLYRKHCAHCHGIDGGGAGPTAYFQNPYPRDFRRGSFKFKTTPVGYKPTEGDLLRILEKGIPGTAMPAFQTLSNSEHFADDVEVLVDYVRFLSIRGESERRLLLKAVDTLDLAKSERFFDPSLKQSNPTLYAAQQTRVLEVIREVAKSWAIADDRVIPVPKRSPENTFAIPGDLDTARKGELLASIQRGRDLFRGQVASCSACHGTEGLGDGATKDFDEWTKDWTIRAGIDPNDKSQWKPMRAYGALSPSRALPRNLRLGVLRGGDQPEDVYRRIAGGIEGTPMPAAPLKPDNAQGLSEQDMWDLVHFVLALPWDDSLLRSLANPVEELGTANQGTAKQGTAKQGTAKQGTAKQVTAWIHQDEEPIVDD